MPGATPHQYHGDNAGTPAPSLVPPFPGAVTMQRGSGKGGNLLDSQRTPRLGQHLDSVFNIDLWGEQGCQAVHALRGVPTPIAVVLHTCTCTDAHTATVHEHLHICTCVLLSVVGVQLSMVRTYTHTHAHTHVQGCWCTRCAGASLPNPRAHGHGEAMRDLEARNNSYCHGNAAPWTDFSQDTAQLRADVRAGCEPVVGPGRAGSRAPVRQYLEEVLAVEGGLAQQAGQWGRTGGSQRGQCFHLLPLHAQGRVHGHCGESSVPPSAQLRPSATHHTEHRRCGTG